MVMGVRVRETMPDEKGRQIKSQRGRTVEDGAASSIISNHVRARERTKWASCHAVCSRGRGEEKRGKVLIPISMLP